MATFDAASAEIETFSDGAVPAVKAWPTRVVCHLTKGYNADQDTETIDAALTINGRVKAGGSESDWKGWRFGFIQLHKIHAMSFWYAGKSKAEGGIGIVVDKAPALTTTLCLDSEETCKPWTRVDEHYMMEGKIRNFSTDHPACRAKRDLTNRITGRVNYLFHVIDKRELWTVFTARNPQGKFQHLAHVRWTLEYNFMFKWRKDEPTVASDSSSFKMTAFQKGAPSDGELQPLLNNPGPPLANDLTREAIKAAVIGGPPNRSDVERSFANVFPDFYPPPG